MSLLYFRASNDYQFLAKALENVAKSNPVIEELLKIMEEINKEGVHQPIHLLWQRAVG